MRLLVGVKKSAENILVEWLVLNSQRGDKRAINLLVKKWHPKLVRQAYRLTGDKDAANDVVQESWQGIIKGLGKLRDPVTFPAWAYQIVTRRSADWIRKLQKDRKITKEEVKSIEIAENEDEDTEDRLKLLRKALHELPREQRVILDLFYLEQLPVKNISNILMLPIGTVKSRLFYAREHLKKIYKKIEI